MTRLAALAATVTAGVALAACGTAATSTGTRAELPAAATTAPYGPGATTTPGATTSPGTTGTPGATAGPGGLIGNGCSSLPTNLANQPLSKAAESNPQLATLVSVIQKAGLTNTLDNLKNVTVFAPNNAAFQKLGKAELAKLLANPGTVSNIVRYHVVPQQLTPSNLAGSHNTLQGTALTVAGSGQNFTVNGATVVCGNIKTANATVYIIDTVLMPK